MNETDDSELEEIETPTAPAAPHAPVEVRRNVGIAAGVAGFAGLLAVAFAARAFTGGTALDWFAFGVLGLIVIVHVAALADARAPLLVADEHGVRLRRGAQWSGIAWPEIDCLEHLPRRGLLGDGHLLVDGYDEEQLVVPLTLATRLVGADSADVADVLAILADGRADVVEVVPGIAEEPEARAATVPNLSDLYADEEVIAPAERGGIAAQVVAGLAGPMASAPSELVETDTDEQQTGEIEPVDHDVESRTAESVVAEPAEAETSTIVLTDLVVEPAASPAIGPRLAEARTRLRLSIDQLAERTRIRPHVIESIEVDDFAPCGGDFYARGHLRTLARVLGVEAGELVARYDADYAAAPVDARRVFEAELATGAGAIRSTRGGRNWSVLMAAVMGAVLVWSVARLVMDAPTPVGEVPVLNQSGGVSHAAAAKGQPVKLTLSAAGGGARLNVRDAAGEIVFDGDLAFGQSTVLKIVPPIRISSSDGSLTYAVGKDTATALGETGAATAKTIVP